MKQFSIKRFTSKWAESLRFSHVPLLNEATFGSRDQLMKSFSFLACLTASSGN